MKIKNVVLVALLAFAVASAHAGLVANGSFESPAITATETDGLPYYLYSSVPVYPDGWVSSGAGLSWLDSRAAGWVASDGSQYIRFNGGEGGYLATSFATQIGVEYQIYFDVASDSRSVLYEHNTLAVKLNGVLAMTGFGYTDGDVSDLDWLTQGIGFFATTTTTSLTFFDSQLLGRGDALLDNVIVFARSGGSDPDPILPSIPEPETYAMMLAGLGLLGVMARRRKQKLNT